MTPPHRPERRAAAGGPRQGNPLLRTGNGVFHATAGAALLLVGGAAAVATLADADVGFMLLVWVLVALAGAIMVPIGVRRIAGRRRQAPGARPPGPGGGYRAR